MVIVSKGGLAPYNKGAIIVAGVGNEDGTTEWYDPDAGTWSVKNSNPQFSRKFYFSTVALQGELYQFGGKDKLLRTLDTVYVMNESFEWSVMDQKLKRGRYGHRSVRSYVRTPGNKKIIHVGGWDEQNVECWELLNNGTFDMKVSNFSIDSWRSYPETFMIDADQFNE